MSSPSSMISSLHRCLSVLLEVDVPPNPWEVASLLLSLGGMGLLSAQRVRCAANWASWADSLGMIQSRHPEVAATMVHALQIHSPGTHVEGAVAARQALVDAGFPLLGKSSQGVSDQTPHSTTTTPQLQSTGGSTWRRNF